MQYNIQFRNRYALALISQGGKEKKKEQRTTRFNHSRRLKACISLSPLLSLPIGFSPGVIGLFLRRVLPLYRGKVSPKVIPA
ncbi:hypothetical protein HAX54_002709 [Datura stramonium]|uniref:Uncharacterized protein n=1 Tax=Datura stramonium TaxID=4076 RepID=A0ABS8RTN2_DATST|nr:hypothetical protein [Datura stramonium]